MSRSEWSPWRRHLLGPATERREGEYVAQVIDEDLAKSSRSTPSPFRGCFLLRVLRDPREGEVRAETPTPRRMIRWESSLFDATIPGARRQATRLLRGVAILDRIRARERASGRRKKEGRKK